LIRPRDDMLPRPPQDAAGIQESDRAAVEASAATSDGAVWNLDALPPELEYFRTSEAYQVDLDIFQGPLDLLLYLIQKDRIDIYDIPIARITDQFLQYLEIIQLLPLDNAGDFLLMAATLLRIKARMLLPVQSEEEPEEEDPRAELVRRLLEYKRFKEAAAGLRRQEEERRQYYLRSSRFPFMDSLNLEPPLRIEMFDLLAALAGVFDRLVATPIHNVRREVFTVEQKLVLIREKLAGAETLRFEDLFAEDAIKMEVVVTFMAILEMVKRGELAFLQTEIDGPIWLQASAASDAADAAATEPSPQAEAQA
jgi:segregation and condensation protein A